MPPTRVSFATHSGQEENARTTTSDAVGGAKRSRWQRVWPWLAAVVCGLLCTGCFPPFDQTWLCWISVTPLLAAIWFSEPPLRRRWLRDTLLGYVAGLAFFWPCFSWLITVTGPGWF